MTTHRPNLADPVDPTRVRTLPRHFAWVDHRLRDRLRELRLEEIALLLFLHLAADRHGLSFWSDATIARKLAPGRGRRRPGPLPPRGQGPRRLPLLRSTSSCRWRMTGREPGPRRPRRSAGHHARAPARPAHGTRCRTGAAARAGGAGRRRHLPGARWLQAASPLAPRGRHAHPRGRGSRRVLQGGGQGPAARGQHAQAHREPDGRSSRGPLPRHRRSAFAHADHQAARPRARLGGPALDARPAARPRVRAPPRRRATVGHHRARPGQPARPRAAASGREHRAPRTAHPRGRGRARHVARGIGHRDARGAAARSAQRYAGARRARSLPARAHRARTAGAFPPDRARPARAHPARSHRLPRPRPARARRLPTAAGRPRPPTRSHPAEGARHPC